jgi:hypothetical protein
MAENNAVVRVYDLHAETEATIKEPQRSGLPRSDRLRAARHRLEPGLTS